MTVFTARYPGTCTSLTCPHANRFHEGDQVEYRPGSQDIMHHECAVAERRETAIPLCLNCFTKHAPGRECY